MTQRSKWRTKAQEYLQYKDFVGWAWRIQVGHTEYDFPIGIDITVVLKNPEEHKWDLDNVIKAILDGLNKVAYADDTQVADIRARLAQGDEDTVVVELWEHEWTHYSSPSSAESQSLSSSS